MRRTEEIEQIVTQVVNETFERGCQRGLQLAIDICKSYAADVDPAKALGAIRCWQRLSALLEVRKEETGLSYPTKEEAG